MSYVILIAMFLFFVFGAATAGWFVGLVLAVALAPIAFYLFTAGIENYRINTLAEQAQNSVNEANNQIEVTDAVRVAAEENGYIHISSNWTDNSLKARIKRANERAKS